MRHKAIKDLKQLSDSDLFLEVAKGLNHTVENSQEFYTDSELLAEKLRSPGSRVLRTFAEEEAEKNILIYFKMPIHNGSVEGLNNMAKVISHKAYGFRSAKNYILNG